MRSAATARHRNSITPNRRRGDRRPPRHMRQRRIALLRPTPAESDDALEARAWNPSDAAARGAPVELLATPEASFFVSGIAGRACYTGRAVLTSLSPGRIVRPRRRIRFLVRSPIQREAHHAAHHPDVARGRGDLLAGVRAVR